MYIHNIKYWFYIKEFMQKIKLYENHFVGNDLIPNIIIQAYNTFEYMYAAYTCDHITIITTYKVIIII